MSSVTIPLTDEEFAFLNELSAARGLTAEEVLVEQLHKLRGQSLAEVSPAVTALSGIIPSKVDAKGEYHRYLTEKYR